MKYFQKAYNQGVKYFTKGVGNTILKKGGSILQQISPIASYINPALGVGLATAGKISEGLGNAISA